jgi:hypothetical protein
MCHNIVLALEAMGFRGWMFTGINPDTVMGAYADKGIRGLGFRFVRREDWMLPNPVGLDGHYESFCPPYHIDMHTAIRELADRVFGQGGTCDPTTPGPYKRTKEVKESVTPWTAELVSCLGEMAQYVHNTYGKFPGTVPTVYMQVYVQAQHIDTDFYDTHFATEVIRKHTPAIWNTGTINQSNPNSLQRWRWGELNRISWSTGSSLFAHDGSGLDRVSAAPLGGHVAVCWRGQWRNLSSSQPCIMPLCLALSKLVV